MNFGFVLIQHLKGFFMLITNFYTIITMLVVLFGLKLIKKYFKKLYLILNFKTVLLELSKVEAHHQKTIGQKSRT